MAADGGKTVTAEMLHLLRTYWPLLLGNVLEWYEFGIYGLLEVYMQDVFFHGSAVASWMGFAACFVGRPLGGVALGWIGDRFGRWVAVYLSILGMLLGTVGQGLVPTGSVVSIPLLGVLRILQGICTGGEIASVMAYIMEVGARRTLGRSMALFLETTTLGLFLAQAVAYGSSALLGPKLMVAWGWRLPFLLALVPGLVTVYARRKMPESKLFLVDRQKRRNKAAAAEAEQEPGAGRAVKELPARSPARAAATAAPEPLLPKHCNAVLAAIGSCVCLCCFCHTGKVWTISYLKGQGLSVETAMLAGVLMRVMDMVFCFGMGCLVDIFGAGAMSLLGVALITLLGLPLFTWIRAYALDEGAVLLIFGLGYSAMSALVLSNIVLFVAELFPTSIRMRGIGLSWNVSQLVGGFSPMLSQVSLGLSPFGPGLVVSGAGAVSLATILWAMWMERRGALRIANLRPEGYFWRLHQSDASTTDVGTHFISTEVELARQKHQQPQKTRSDKSDACQSFASFVPSSCDATLR